MFRLRMRRSTISNGDDVPDKFSNVKGINYMGDVGDDRISQIRCAK